MPVWLLSYVVKYWKPIGLFAVMAGVLIYIWFLRSSVLESKIEVARLEHDISTLQGDVDTAKSAILAVDNGFKQYQLYVQDSFDSFNKTQRKIADQDAKLQKSLDNVYSRATLARRIEDAPSIPFFILGTIITDNNIRMQPQTH